MVGKVTFLLGAGFSKAFGGPLVSELSDIVSEPPKKIIDPLKFELVDLASLHDGYDYKITSNNKLRYSVNDFISFFNIYKSLLVSEYLKVYYCLPSYEVLIGLMTKDTLLFDPISSNYNFNNELRKNNIIRLGNFIESGVGFEEKFYNLILNCIDYITLLVFDRIKENIDIKITPNPLLTEYIKKNNNKPNILSLNYDKVVEDIFTKNNIEYTDGFESDYWDISEKPIYRFNSKVFEIGKVNLFKLHGSLDYGVVGKDTIGKYIDTTSVKFNSRDVAELKVEFKRKEGYNFHIREFIIGSYNKSEKYFRRTFIDLFNIGISKLNLSDTLIVIGYSFQDIPINLIISNWLKKSEKKKMIVINGKFDGSAIPISSGRAIFNSHLKYQIKNTNNKSEDVNLNNLEEVIRL